MKELKKSRFILIFAFLLCLSFSIRGQQAIEDVGHYTQLGLPITALGISLAKGDKEGTIQLIKSFALETVVTIGLKRSINRERPNGKPYSFPSGHTALSFMSSTFLWKRYGWKYGVPATILASFVGYSRFGTDQPVHYFSDVMAGAIIGIGSSLLFTKKRMDKTEVQVIGDTSFIGLRLQMNLN